MTSATPKPTLYLQPPQQQEVRLWQRLAEASEASEEILRDYRFAYIQEASRLIYSLAVHRDGALVAEGARVILGTALGEAAPPSIDQINLKAASFFLDYPHLGQGVKFP